MWQANKTAILLLAAGLLVLAGIYAYLAQGDKELAQKVLSAGFCALLLAVGCFSLFTARK